MQTELHRHLDVSIRHDTLLKLAQAQGLEGESTSLESFQNKLIIRKPLAGLSEFLEQFSIYQKVLNRPEALERTAFECVEDCWREGTRKVELRYSPAFVGEFSQLPWNEALFALKKGMEQALYRYPEMKAGLICIATRDYGVENVDQTVEFFLKHFVHFIGLDLAGNESQYPCKLFQSSFKKAISKQAKITIHAGEADGPESIWEAIELLGAQRIGHGVASIQDPKLIDYLIKNKICLEMCPTSNWITQVVPSHQEHPLPQLLRTGVPVSINTDDPSILGITLNHEIQICREQMGMSLLEIEKCRLFATSASFI